MDYLGNRCPGTCFFKDPGAWTMPETVVHFQIRMPPRIHENLASWAKEDKASLNALIVGLLEQAIDSHAKQDEPEAKPEPKAEKA